MSGAAVPRLAGRVGVASTLLVIGLIATACGSGSDVAATTSNAPSQAAESTAPTETAEPVQAEPAALVASTADGGQLDWGTLEGRDVVLWFWAPW